MRIAFLGTPDFALPSLQTLIERGEEIVCVFTQPDRPKGRGYAPAVSPVKRLALAHSLSVCQTEKIRSEEGQKALMACRPELMVTAAFGQILSKENLAVPAYGCINVHASLLPKYRGSAPIQWAVMRGEKVTGVTTMMTDVGVDTGDILLQRETAIGEAETAGELFERLSILGAETLGETLDALKNGTLERRPQDHSLATHYPMLKKEDGRIDFSRTAGEILNLVRGVDPWPGAHFFIGDKMLKVFRARVSQGAGQAGEVLCASPTHGFVVACKDGAVAFGEVQSAGGKRMDAASFLRGASIPAGQLCL